MARAATLVLLLLWSPSGCERRATDPPPARATVAPSSPLGATAPTVAAHGATAATSRAPAGSSTAPRLPVLEDAGQLTALKVEGFGDAVVAVPAAPAPRPLVLATHGNYDRPSWQCQEWQQLLRDRAFVLCPRGSARPDSPGPDDVRFTYGSNEELEREIDAGMAALKARYGAWLVDGPVVYTGFSLGAILGVKIAARRPASFPRLVLIEGGHDGWTYARVKAFAAGGGKRVLFACGQKGCQLAAASAAQRLRATEVDSRVVLAPGVGHSYGGPVSGLIAEELPWLLAPATPE